MNKIMLAVFMAALVFFVWSMFGNKAYGDTSCEVTEKLCGRTCIPVNYVCCNDDNGGWCPPNYKCMEGRDVCKLTDED
jgi:hypothetical protein